MIAHRILSLRSLRRLRFAADRRGVSAVEFALLLPLMLTMYFGNFVVSEAIIVARQVTLMASTGAEITSQYSQVSLNDLTNIINAAATVLNGGQTPQPFPIANANLTLSSVLIDGNGKATIDWSKALTGAGRGKGSVVTSSIPAGLVIINTSLIWGEATYNYTPVVGSAVWTGINGAQPMSDQIFLRPRQSNSVVCTNC